MSEWAKIASTADLDPGQVKQVYVGDEPVMLANIDGDIYAINDVCSHEYVMLSEGWLDGYDIECPQHGSRFDVRSGAVDGLPATQPVPAYELRVEQDEIYILIDERGQPEPRAKTDANEGA